MKKFALIGAAVLNIIAAIACCVASSVYLGKDMFFIMLAEVMLYGIGIGFLHYFYRKKLDISTKAFRMSLYIPTGATAVLFGLVMFVKMLNVGSGMFSGLEAAGYFLTMVVVLAATAIFLLIVWGMEAAVVGIMNSRSKQKNEEKEE